MMAASGVHARVMVEVDCTLASCLEGYSVLRFVPGNPPQVLVEPPGDGGGFDDVLNPVVHNDDTVVCRIDTDALDSSSRAAYLAAGFRQLPVEPYNLRWQDEHVYLSFAAQDDEELQAAVRELEAVDFDVELRQLTTDGDEVDGDRDTAVIDLSTLTERQRTLAARAAAVGYFEPDGPSAERVADGFDINKATLSEHLRSVQRELIQQTFGT